MNMYLGVFIGIVSFALLFAVVHAIFHVVGQAVINLVEFVMFACLCFVSLGFLYLLHYFNMFSYWTNKKEAKILQTLTNVGDTININTIASTALNPTSLALDLTFMHFWDKARELVDDDDDDDDDLPKLKKL